MRVDACQGLGMLPPYLLAVFIEHVNSFPVHVAVLFEFFVNAFQFVNDLTGNGIRTGTRGEV